MPASFSHLDSYLLPNGFDSTGLFRRTGRNRRQDYQTRLNIERTESGCWPYRHQRPVRGFAGIDSAVEVRSVKYLHYAVIYYLECRSHVNSSPDPRDRPICKREVFVFRTR
ncbi:hypothetical protein Trydic_g7130 [Trypoxylus dichotomus]